MVDPQEPNVSKRMASTPFSTLGAVLVLFCASAEGAKPAAAPVVRVEFDASANPEARALINSGVQALHDFWYARAIEHFDAAQGLDSSAVLAYFGEALAVHDPFGLGPCDPAPMRRVLAKLAPDSEARAALARSEREREYLAAVERLAGSGDVEERHRGFAEGMRRVVDDYPDDLESSAFYALSLFGTADNLRKYPELREEVAAVTATILAREPLHPGGLHYTIHALDTPSDAHRLLGIARRYVEVAAAPHAIHMSSHVFLQHGMFEDSVATNRKAYELSVEWAADTGRDASAHDWHGADFLHYSLLQLGRVKEARSWREKLKAEQHGMLRYYRATWAARESLERGGSTELVAAVEFGSRTEYLAAVVNALGRRDLVTARSLLALVGERAAGAKGNRSAFAEHARWLALGAEIQALIFSQEGDHEAAIESAKRAIDFAGQAPPPNETPDPPIPPSELLGDILLAAGRPAEAARAYSAALTLWRGRLRSRLGFARATAAAGLPYASRAAYQQLLEQLAGGDHLAEAKEARKALAASAGRASGR